MKLDTLGERLDFLIDLKGLRKKDISDELNIAPNTLSGYISGSRNPDVNMLKKIAQYLNVSTDFLLGLSDDYRTYIERDYNGKLIEIKFDNGTTKLSEKEINELFSKLEKVGWDINKLIASK